MPLHAADRAFVKAIVARPADDGPRLVFADFLDESPDPADQARAELIRLQCALSRLPGEHPRRAELADRVGELLLAHRAAWSEALGGLTNGVEFRRGMLESVSLDAGTFVDRGDELFRKAPIRRVRLTDAVRHLARVAESPVLGQVRELDLSGNDLGNGGVQVLLHSPYLARLEALDLSFNSLGDLGIRHLAHATGLPRLRSLALTDNTAVGADGIASLAESPHLAGLRTLDVSGIDLHEVGVQAIASSRFLTRLHTFRIRSCGLADHGVAELARSSLFGRMTARSSSLDLRENLIGDEGIAALAGSPHLARLSSLDLSKNLIADRGLWLLANSPNLPKLRRLAIRSNYLKDDGAAALAASPLMARLKAIDISSNQLTRKGVNLLWAYRRDFQTVLDTRGNLTAHEPEPDGAAPTAEMQKQVGQALRRLERATAIGGRI